MPANAGDAIYVNSIPWSRRSSFQYSSLEKSTDRGTLWTTVRGDAKSQTQLSTHTYTLMLLCYCIHHFGFVFVSICFLSFLFCYIVICRLTLVLCLDSVFFFVCIYCRQIDILDYCRYQVSIYHEVLVQQSIYKQVCFKLLVF